MHAVVNQKYEAEILTEYVINGNAGILKCNIPSFVADFVQVESWIRDDGVLYKNAENDDFGRMKFRPFQPRSVDQKILKSEVFGKDTIFHAC